MDPLRYLVEPTALLLTWQPADEGAPRRTRRVVGRIERAGASEATFTYLEKSEDFLEARASGFQGFPAFNLSGGTMTTGVLDAFLKRLPSRSREDFSRYLAVHRLPHPFPLSDFALLGYTGARLPGDGFDIAPEFEPALRGRLELLVEVAGVRHTFGGQASDLTVGDEVTFDVECSNPVDADAVRVLWHGEPLGYVNRALRQNFCEWLRTRRVSGRVDHVNGKPARPLVYVRVLVEDPGLQTASIPTFAESAA